jgi:hypothetical protein
VLHDGEAEFGSDFFGPPNESSTAFTVRLSLGS